METKRHIIYIILQWTWGIIQNIIGGLLYLICIRNNHTRFRGSIVTLWHYPYSMGCGMFIFISNKDVKEDDFTANNIKQCDILIHEYGHTLQSIILGPLFLFVIAIPSMIWSAVPYFQKKRKEKGISYYTLYCEKWANDLGDRICQGKR